MRFNSTSDIQMFLLEAGETDLAANLPENFSPSEEMVELFLKRRNKSIIGLKDFRKSQTAKSQWRSDRYKMMKGINTFHKSTAGKKFHRQLGRFLSTRIPLTGQGILSMRESSGNLYQEISDTCKALASFKTHAFILLENFMPTSAYVDYLIFLESIVPEISKVEKAIISLETIPSESLDFLAASISKKSILSSLEKDGNFDTLCVEFDKLLKSNSKSEFPFLESIKSIKTV